MIGSWFFDALCYVAGDGSGVVHREGFVRFLKACRGSPCKIVNGASGLGEKQGTFNAEVTRACAFCRETD